MTARSVFTCARHEYESPFVVLTHVSSDVLCKRTDPGRWHAHVPASLPAQVLYDLGVVSTPEPFQRLVSQGMILGEVEYTAHQDPDSGAWVDEGAPGAVPVRCCAAG